jgi:hypothetical protein
MSMLALQIRINDQPAVTAGVDDWLLVHANIVINRRIEGRDDQDHAHMHIGGMAGTHGAKGDHLRWGLPDLALGDTITVRIVETDAPDPPAARHAADRPLPDIPFSPEEWRELQHREYLRLKAMFEAAEGS